MENNLQKQQQEKGENMKNVAKQLLEQYSNLANMPQGTIPQKVLAGFMDLTSVPLGFAADALQRGLKVAEDVSLKGTYLGVGSTYKAGKFLLSKGFGRDNPARKMREAELGLLKGNLETDIKKLKEIHGVINSLKVSVEETQSAKKELEVFLQSHPSSKLLKAMTKYEKERDREGGVQGRMGEHALTALARAITDEFERLEKFKNTETSQLKGFKKVITELHNWFKDIMLSFRESKLQGLKHVALGFGELLLGIGAVVATFAAALVLIPLVVVPCFGINLATRITSFLAGVCVLVANRLYHAFAMLNSALFLKRDQQDDFSKSIDGRVKELDDLQIRLFDLAMKTPSKGEPENLSSDPYTSKGEVEQHSAGGSEQQVSSGGEGSEKHLGGGASQSVTNELTHAVQSVSAAASHGQQQSILDAGANPNL